MALLEHRNYLALQKHRMQEIHIDIVVYDACCTFEVRILGRLVSYFASVRNTKHETFVTWHFLTLACGQGRRLQTQAAATGHSLWPRRRKAAAKGRGCGT